MLDEAAFERDLLERRRLQLEEAAANPQTPEHLARRETFWAFACQHDPDRPGSYVRGLGQSIWQDGIAAFDEGVGENSCPFRSGAWRRRWVEAYHSAERESE
jgi:hypothetical protein